MKVGVIMRKHETLVFTMFLRVCDLYSGLGTNYSLGAITSGFFYRWDLLKRSLFVGKKSFNKNIGSHDWL